METQGMKAKAEEKIHEAADALRSGDDQRVDELITKLEEGAESALRTAAEWLALGEDYVTKTRQWLAEHPKAREMAAKAAGAVSVKGLNGGLPRSKDELRETGRSLVKRLRNSSTSGWSTIKQHPVDTVLIGSALFIVAAVLVKNR
jgi:ElaB/YqjD/DUF883 family membrane-anchored ribosome-binding protein